MKPEHSEKQTVDADREFLNEITHTYHATLMARGDGCCTHAQRFPSVSSVAFISEKKVKHNQVSEECI